jgi:hypothetical protein
LIFHFFSLHSLQELSWPDDLLRGLDATSCSWDPAIFYFALAIGEWLFTRALEGGAVNMADKIYWESGISGHYRCECPLDSFAMDYYRGILVAPAPSFYFTLHYSCYYPGSCLDEPVSWFGLVLYLSFP